MAKKSSLERWKRDAVHPKFKVRFHNRCRVCGRPRAFIRKFSLKYRAMVFAGDTVRAEGEISAIRAEGEHDIVAVAQRLKVGDRIVVEASAEVQLPR